MKNATIRKSSLLTTLALAIGLAVTSTSCTTTYDQFGNQRQSVDPGLAVAGAAAAGIVGYSLASSRNNNQRRVDHYRNQHHVHHHPHHGRHQHPHHGGRHPRYW